MMVLISRFRLLFAGAALCALALTLHTDGLATVAAQAPAIEPSLLNAYRWRSIGPDRGGRSIAVSGVKGRPREAYFGAVGGGLWKTTDAGNNWAPVTDGQITSSSVGAVAVSESHPDIVYIGMGENCIRGNIMPGDGVYKSVDGGQKWSHVGFRNSDAISKIRIHPTNPDIVYVASFGLYYGPSEERGVFKSTDGGQTWKRTLFKDARSGAVDIVIDANNPNVIYAALWEAYRIEYQMSSGGPGSGLYKSTDGGETWTEITRNPGLPSGVVGRIGIANTKADSNRVYALVENENGGLFVSDDAGASWKLINPSRAIRQRAFYYTHVFGDPSNKDVVYMQNTALFRSTDGGKTTVQVGQNTHGDHHDLWVDPDDPNHVVDGNDGGGAITYDISSARPNWSEQDFPTAQWYHVITTAHLPFHVCGSQQDNSTLCVPSNTNAPGQGFGGVPPVAPYPVGGGEPGYIAPHATDPDLFFGGTNNGSFLTRLNRRTGEFKEVGAYPRFFSGEPSKDVKERWQWTYPIIFSYVDPNVLYTSSQRVWKTTNGGDTWEAISGDLSRHDPKTMQDSGGPITHDMNSPEIYGTVFSLAPGKKDINVIWAGSDDGLVHVTRDHGKSWINVTPADMPDFGRVSQLDGSSFDNGTVYMAVKKMLLGDRSPYIFRSRDYGKTWTKIVNGIPANDYVHTVREDPVRRGLLYAGTQHGVYVSYDDGAQWLKFSNGLPDVPVTDLVVEDNALAIGTHGRSFYVMDDIAALRQFGLAPLTDVAVFKPADATRGLDRPIVTYYLKSQPKALTIDFLDAKGQVVRTVNGVPPPAPGTTPAGGGGGFGGPQGAPMAAGMNRFTWDLNSTGIVTFPGMILWGATQNGPAVLPGTYQVRLTADGVVQTQSFAVLKHPLRPVPDADLMYQWTLASRIRDKVNEANRAVIQIRRIKTDIADRIKDAPAEVRSAGEQLAKALSAVEEDIYQVKNQSGQDPLNFPIKTNNRLASLLRVAVSGEGRPTGNVDAIFNDLIAELKAETDRLDQTLADQLPPFNNMLGRIKKAPISDR
ncbi:MAG: glycosyl hydrolase [Vicinamibacterales bacterium]